MRPPAGTIIRAAVVTMSDRSFRKERPDASGPAVAEMLRSLPAEIAQQVVIPDEIPFIRRVLLHFCDTLALDLVVTTGGTGVDPRDVTPDATREVLDREVPGMAEAMRAESLKRVPAAMLSRAVVGIRGKTLIVNLPGSPRGAVESLDAVAELLPHALEVLRGARHD